jgi:hypothetical protein
MDGMTERLVGGRVASKMIGDFEGDIILPVSG